MTREEVPISDIQMQNNNDDNENPNPTCEKVSNF